MSKYFDTNTYNVRVIDNFEDYKVYMHESVENGLNKLRDLIENVNLYKGYNNLSIVTSTGRGTIDKLMTGIEYLKFKNKGSYTFYIPEYDLYLRDSGDGVNEEEYNYVMDRLRNFLYDEVYPEKHSKGMYYSIYKNESINPVKSELRWEELKNSRLYTKNLHVLPIYAVDIDTF